MNKLWVDCETYNAEPISKGTHAYAETVEVMIVTWAEDDGPTQTWDVTTGAPMPESLATGLREAPEVWAHNSTFDRTMFRHWLGPLCPPIERWRDTMVQALSHSLPGGLAVLCGILRVPSDIAKNKEGKALIQLFCKLRKFSHSLSRIDGETPAQFKARVEVAKASWIGRATSATHPAQWANFLKYASDDIDAMRACHKRMPMWNYKGRELDLWHLDQKINDRGVAVDMDLVRGAIAAVQKEQLSLAAQTVANTDGALVSTTQRDKMLAHVLEAHGVSLPDLQMSTLERRVDDTSLPWALRELLAIRLQASTSSTSKYKALLGGTSGDCRLRGTLQFNGAARTGRWCLAEGSVVKIKTVCGVIAEIPIQDVDLTDEVWDGESWVRHEGVVFSGDKPVITWDGVTATPSHDRRVVGDRFDGFVWKPYVAGAPLWIADRVETATKMNVVRDLRPREFPRVAVGQPILGIFLLPSILDDLTKQPVVIADAVTAGWNSKTCHALHEAGREPAEAAIAEGSIRLGRA